ncbi:hypothetical protein VI06_15600 [Aquitalea magnusonii]|nr:hypothetical protein VI06_15600 [Aquitalea magnusonii]
MGLSRLLIAMSWWKKFMLTVIVLYLIFFIFISFFSVKDARYLSRTKGEIYAEINSRYQRKAASAVCWIKGQPFSYWHSIGYATENDNFDAQGEGSSHFYKYKQVIVMSDTADIRKDMTLTCILHQINFNIFIPASNEFEITVK